MDGLGTLAPSERTNLETDHQHKLELAETVVASTEHGDNVNILAGTVFKFRALEEKGE